MGKVLITGITGNVGIYVYEALYEMNEDIVGAVTSIEKSKNRFPDCVKLVEFDFSNPSKFENALDGVDRVFLIRPPHLGKPEDLFPFITAMKQKGVNLVCFLSLMGVEKNPIPPHHKIEKYIEKSGLSYCHLRPGFFMQNLSGVHANEIKEKNEIFIPAGKSRCSFIDCKDIGFFAAKVLKEYQNHQNTAYTITGSESLDYYEISKILSSVLNKNIVYKSPSWLRFRQYMIHHRKLEKNMVNVMVMLYFMTRLGTAKQVHHDFEKITGQKPRTFREFAEQNKENWV